MQRSSWIQCKSLVRSSYLNKRKSFGTFQKSFSGLTKEQVTQFNCDGYLVLPNFWSNAICDSLMERMSKLLSKFDPNEEKKSIFTTIEQERVSDEYFLTSGDKIRFFFEENAFDAKGNLVQDKTRSINKVGHCLHDLDPLFKKHSRCERVAKICKSLDFIHPAAAQSMYIFKQAHIGGEVVAHQDGTFLATDPQSAIGFWWALEDCDESNACLYGVPGSHKQGIQQRFIRNPNGKGTLMEPKHIPPYDIQGAIPLKVTKGALILLHNAFVHYSGPNASDKTRHAYALHVLETHQTKYYKDNWLQLPSGKSFPLLY